MKSQCCKTKIIVVDYIDQHRISICSECLQKATAIFPKKLVSILVLLSILFVTLSTHNSIVTQKMKGVYIDTVPELTETNIKFYLHKYHIFCEDVVFKQILVETSHLTSPVCLIGHNLFGQKWMGRRPHRKTTQIGEYLHHAKYDNWVKSIEDYYYWQQMHKRSLLLLYTHFLTQAGYAENTEYENLLNQM